MDERERWCIDYEREQSQVMIVNQSDAPSILSVPIMPLHWQDQSQHVRRKPVSVRVGQEDPGWEVAREGRGYQELATERRGRFPSLRVAGNIQRNTMVSVCCPESEMFGLSSFI